jgi:hypothetical protein
MRPVDICHEYAHTIYGTRSLRITYARDGYREASMVVDLKRLTDSLRKSSPKEDLRQDLERIIGARKADIDRALESGESYSLRVPDGRWIRISRRMQPANASQ